MGEYMGYEFSIRLNGKPVEVFDYFASLDSILRPLVSKTQLEECSVIEEAKKQLIAEGWVKQ